MPAIRIDKIEGLLDAHVACFLKEGITTVGDLWSNVGADFNVGIQQVSRKTNVPEDVITALLIADGLGQLKGGWLSYFKRPEIVVTLITVALTGYALFAVRGRLPQQIVVKNPKGIAAYQPIGEDDIVLRRVPFGSDQTLSDPKAVIGGYALTKLAPNTPIRRDQVLSGEVSRRMSGGYVISLPVKASSVIIAPRPGSTLSLVPLPDEKTNNLPPTATINALLLGIEQREDGPILVVLVNSAENVTALLGGSTIVRWVPGSGAK